MLIDTIEISGELLKSRLRPFKKKVDCQLKTPFHSILAAIGTPTYKLAKFLLQFLTTHSTANEDTVINLFHLTEEIINRIKSYSWLVQTLIHYLQIFLWTRLLIFALTTCTTVTRIP